MPVEMPDLALQLFVPVDIVAPRFLLRDRFGIVRDAEKTEACDDGIELVILPMPGEIVELGKEIVEGIVCRIELIDVSSRSEEHTSALQSLMRISYAVFCLKKKTT